MGRGWLLSEYKPVDYTETFDKSHGETITHNNTTVNNGSVELGAGPTGNVTSRTNDSATYDATGVYGVEFNPNTSLDGIQLNISGSTDATSGNSTLVLREGSTILDSISGSFSAGESYKLYASLTSGTTYIAGIDFDSADTDGYTSSTSFPYTGTDLDITAAWNDGSSTTSYADAVNDLQGISSASSGDALIYWGLPSDLQAWNQVQLERTLDNEKVSVSIEDSNGTELKSASGATNIDISDISSGTEVRVRVTLDRNDTSNNPTFDYLGVQYER